MESEGAAAVEAPPAAPSRPKAKQKTPEQKAVLEGVFTTNQHPDEATRQALASQLALTMQEVTAWFQNKRRRAKNKAEAALNTSKDVLPAADDGTGPAAVTPGPVMHSPAADPPSGGKRKSDSFKFPPQPTFSSQEEQAMFLHKAHTLFEGFRADGPPISFLFDDPPSVKTTKQSAKRKASDVSPGLAGTAPAKAPKKALDPQEALQKQLEEEEKKAKKVQQKAAREQAKLDNTLKKEQEKRERESERERLKREKEANRLRTEAVKAEEKRQKQLARQREKELKAEAKMQAKQNKEEAKRAKLAQKEAQRQQAKQQKEKEKLEKKNQRELLKKQKEAERRNKNSLALKLREVEPPDDLDIEMADLREKWIASNPGPGREAAEQTPDSQIIRPPFPPPNVTERLMPAFQGALADNHCELGGNMLMLWSFISEFSSLIAYRPIGILPLMEAIQTGSLSLALVNLHIAFIRFIQSEAEIANAIGSVHVGMERMSQTVSRAAGLVTEALTWGLDISTWRAHLNELTWPEILRQLALAAGWGPRRCRPARAARSYDDRKLGEDVVEQEDGTLKFAWPSRFQPNPAPGDHTVKEACWKVLADMAKTEDDIATAARGLPVREIARRIEEQKLRKTKSATIVEGSVAGALSRDSLFAYVAPGTYALQAIVHYWRKHKERLERKARGESCEGGDGDGGASKEDAGGGAANGCSGANTGTSTPANGASAAEGRKEREEEEYEEEDEEEDEPDHSRRAWVDKLMSSDYDALTTEERVEALMDLMHLALDLPSIHSSLDRHHDEVERQKRLMREEAKEERKNRQRELAEKANRDAKEAEMRVTALKQKILSGEDVEMAAPPEEQAAVAAAKANGGCTPAENATGTDEANVAAEAAVAKLKAQLEAAQRSEREASTTAAEALQREALGKRLHAVELTNAIRDEPVGMDRRCNRYRWYGGGEPGPQRVLRDRVLFEDGETGSFSMFVDPQDIPDLRQVLDPRGVREAHLSRAWDFYGDVLESALRDNGDAAPAAIELPPPPPAAALEERREGQFGRFLAIKTAGMSVLGEDGEVRPSDYRAEDPPAVKKLKSEMLCVESAIPEQAMTNPDWDRVAWIRRTQGATTLPELRKLLGTLESNLKDKWLSPTFVREPQLVKNAFNPIGKEVAAIPLVPGHTECMRLRAADVHHEVIDEPLAWLPLTASALLFRLLCLDAAVCYGTGPESRPWRERLVVYRYVQVPVMLNNKPTGDSGRISTACGIPTYTAAGLFPILPLTAVPMDAVELSFDAQAMLDADDDELRCHVPAGLKQSKPVEAPAQKKAQPKKKPKKRSDDDDITRAADILSSEDDFQDMVYAYGQAAPAYQSTPAASDAAEEPHDDPDDPDPSISEDSGEDDDDDFVR